jgi:inosine-uridine nucleoside N-ribohydrolase
MAVAAIGPLTNIALLAARGITPPRLVVLGGAIGPGNMPSGAEFNLAVDPLAAQAVLARPCTLVPLDIARAALATPARIAAIAAAGPVGARIAPMLTAYAEADRRKTGAAGGMLPDAHAIAALVDPGLYTWRQAAIAVDGMGRTRFDWATEKTGEGAAVAVGVDEEGFFALVSRLLGML